jgi:cold-inducible RNA-binding protein
MNSSNGDTGTRLYVGNLPYSMRTPDLFKLFSEYGEIVDAVVMMESDNKDRSRGFGFVTMKNAEDADKAVLAVNGKEILGREMICNVAKPREPRFDF